MKLIGIIVALIVLYLFVEMALFYFRVTHLKALPAIDQSDRSLGSGPGLRYIAAGDSTAVGVGATDFTKSYPYKVAEYLAKARDVAYKNIAVKGYTTADVLKKQLEQIISFKPDVVTISMGANDATHLVGANKIISNYKTIISKLKAETSAKIYITDIANFNGAHLMPWFYIRLIELRSKSINEQILGLEDERVKIINIHDFGWQNYPDLSITYATDNFHPNDISYQNWANAFLDKIGKNF